MKILLINKFLYPKGGDAKSALSTGKLLEAKGHQVVFWGMQHSLNLEFRYKDLFVNFVDLNDVKGIVNKVMAGLKLLYSLEAKEKVERVIRIEKPDIVHLHNFAHQVSPSILHVFKKYNIPVVMTMHDYKLVCAAYSLRSNGKICESCEKGRHYFCFLKRCIKNSYLKSLLNAIEMYLHHNILHIYKIVNNFIAPSMFMKHKIEEMGFKGEIVYLTNFINLKDYSEQYEWKEHSIVYFGRIAREKGIACLIEAVKGLDVKLKIIGDGDLRFDLERYVVENKISNVEFLGFKDGEDLKNEIRNCMFTVLPSECYENNPISLIEGFALGKTAIASNIGGIPELIKNEETGLLFKSGDANDLRSKIKYLLSETSKIIEMGKKARQFVKNEFNEEEHYNGLIGIYNWLLKNNS